MMTRAAPSSGKITYSKTVTYLSFERPHDDWIEWEIFVRQAIRLFVSKTGKVHEQVVRHNGCWRELHPIGELDKFLASNIEKITQISAIETKIGLMSGRSKQPLPFLLWSDESLGIY